MALFRKKSPAVEMVPFTGQAIPGGFVNATDHPVMHRTTHGMRTVPPGHGLISTLEGPYAIEPGDQLATEADGTQYPVPADVFAADYEPVAPGAASTAPVAPATAPVVGATVSPA